MSTRRRFVQQFRTVLANLTFYPVETDVHLLAPEEEPQPLERTSENAETDLQAFVECCSKLVRIVPHFESIMSSMFARFSMFDAEIVQEALDGFLPYLARHPEIIAFDDRMAMVLRHRIIDRLRRRRACRNREVHAIQNCAEYHFHDKMLQERIRYVQELDRIMGTLRPFENPIHCQTSL